MMPAPTDRVPPLHVHRVLVTKLRHHGDVLLISPVLTALGRALPHAQIDVLVYAETAPMIERHPALARVFTIDRSTKRRGPWSQLMAELTLLRSLRARSYDLLVHLTAHPRGLTLAVCLRPRWAVTCELPARRLPGVWKRAFTHFYPVPAGGRSRHAVELNLDALRRIGIQPLAEDRKLVMVPGDQARSRIDAMLAAMGLDERGFIHVHPGSRWLFKCWPAGRMASLIARLCAEGHAVVLTGAPEAHERAHVDTLLAALPAAARTSVHDLTGKLTLPELAALTARAQLFIGVDSAPMHIAAAMGTPTIALFGPSDDIEWGPWGVTHRIVASQEHPCRPCRNDGCGGGKVSDCLTTLGVERVKSAVDALIAQTLKVH